MGKSHLQNHCFKEFIWYASLNVLGMIALSCYILADTYFVANGLGSNGLAALNLAIPVYSFIHGTGLMLGMGGATRYSMLRSQGQEKKSNLVFTHSLVLVLCFAIFFVTLGLFFSAPLARLLGADTTVFDMCETYLKVLLLFSPMFLLNDCILCFARNDGTPQLSMAAMVTGSLSNVVLDYVFIFPMGMGIFGAVLATGLAPVISLGVLSPLFLKKRNHFHMVKLEPSSRMFGYIFATGVPSLVTEVSSGIVMIVFNMILLGLAGNSGVAAYGVIANLSLVVIAIYTGIAQGIQPLLSKYYGCGAADRVRKIFRYAVTTLIGLSALIYCCVFFGAEWITAAFNSDGNAALTAIAVPGLRIYFTGGIFAGLNIVMSVYFTSTDNASPANIISLLRGFLVILPMSFLLSGLFQLTGLWAAFPVTELLVTVVGVVLLRRCRSMKKKTDG